MPEFYFAAYAIGGDTVKIYDQNGCGQGSYSVGEIAAPAALAPRMFVFLTSRGMVAIDAATGSSYNY